MGKEYHESMPSELHCPRCKTLMEKGICPACGHKIYVPMDKEKQNKIKLVATCVLMVVFVVLLVALKIKNG